MTRNTNVDSAVTYARFMVLPPEEVYQELREDGAAQLSSDWQGAVITEEMEMALLGRSNPLINLALAQFGGAAVVRQLYTRAKEGAGDRIQDRAIRRACLANQLCGDKVFDDAEIRRLVLEAVPKSPKSKFISHDTDVSLLLSNPARRRLIAKLLNQKPPFDDLPNEKFRWLVKVASGNPALAVNKSSRFGPDLDAEDITGGIFQLLKTMPVEPDWADVFIGLLYPFGPGRVHPDSDPMIVLNRWRALPPEEKEAQDDIYGFAAGYWTHSLQPRQEFLCFMAAVFGHWLQSGSKKDPATGRAALEYHTLGSFDDPDQLMRCAYYGHAKLTSKQIEIANRRDGDAFMLAALCNDLMYTTEARAKLEELMRGHVRHFYYRRCKQKNADNKDFDPLPVSENGRELLDDVIEFQPSDELKQINGLAAHVNLLETRLSRLQRYAGWTLALVALTVIWLIFRR